MTSKAYAPAQTNTPQASMSSPALAQTESNAAAQSQLGGDQQTQTPTLDAVDAEQGKRVTGRGADTLLQAMGGEPAWAVTDTNSSSFFNDRIEVVSHEHRNDTEQPAWYGQARSLGNRVCSQTSTQGGWWVLQTSTGGGIYAAGRTDTLRNVGDYFRIDYVAAKPREGLGQKLLSPDGEVTWAYGAYTVQRLGFSVIQFLSPGSNILQAATGRKLDPYADDFGERLSTMGVSMEVLTAAAKLAPMFRVSGALGTTAELSQAERIGYLAGILAETSNVTIDGLKDLGLVDAGSEHTLRAITQLLGAAGAFTTYRGGDPLAVSDYLASISALSGASEEVLRGVLGDDGFEKFWVKHLSAITTVTNDLGNFATVIEKIAEVQGK